MALTDLHTATFEEYRSLLTGVGYRMLGSVSDAEDIVQEAWMRWAEAKGVTAPKSWLLKVVSRLCLDRLKSARKQREQYYGTWLPEPFLETEKSLQTSPGEVDESVSIALLVVLEKLSPEERAGFLLHDVFGCDFREVGRILGKPVVNCRSWFPGPVSECVRKSPDLPPQIGSMKNSFNGFSTPVGWGSLSLCWHSLANPPQCIRTAEARPAQCGKS